MNGRATSQAEHSIGHRSAGGPPPVFREPLNAPRKSRYTLLPSPSAWADIFCECSFLERTFPDL
jgi:hypothetical protein